MFTNMESADFNDQLLRQHVKSGNIAEVLSLLQGSDICQFVDHDKSTLLHLAAEYGNLDLAQCLIDLGADVDAQNNFGQTPIMIAIKRYNTNEIVRLLLKANADIYVPDAQGKCALGTAFNLIEKGNANIHRQILRSVTVESLRKSPYTKTKVFHDDCSLDNFPQLKNVEIIRALLDMGSPINVQNQYLNPAFAKKCSSPRSTALHEAVNHLAVDIVKLLVERGADVNAEDDRKQTPLALFPSDIEDDEKCEIVKILLNAGAALIHGSDSKLLMESILSKGSRQTIRAVLQSNAGLCYGNEYLPTPMEYLFDNHSPNVAEELENLDIDVNIRYEGEMTLLHLAAKKGHPGFTRLLLKRGADVNSKNAYNHSPLFMAVNPSVIVMEKIELVDRVEERKNKWFHRFNCIAILLENGADPQIFTKDINYAEIMRFRSLYLHLTVGFIRPIFDYLALDEANGRPIDQFMMDEIQNCEMYWKIFDSNRKNLEAMKRIMIDEDVNLFEFLVAKRVSRYAKSEAIVTNLTRILSSNIDSYYYRRLQFNFVKLAKLIAINDIFVDFYKISAVEIAEKIVNYTCCNR